MQQPLCSLNGYPIPEGEDRFLDRRVIRELILEEENLAVFQVCILPCGQTTELCEVGGEFTFTGKEALGCLSTRLQSGADCPAPAPPFILR